MIKKDIKVNIDNEEIILNSDNISFYLHESHKKRVNKSSISKFFSNLKKFFNITHSDQGN